MDTKHTRISLSLSESSCSDHTFLWVGDSKAKCPSLHWPQQLNMDTPTWLQSYLRPPSLISLALTSDTCQRDECCSKLDKRVILQPTEIISTGSSFLRKWTSFVPSLKVEVGMQFLNLLFFAVASSSMLLHSVTSQGSTACDEPNGPDGQRGFLVRNLSSLIEP